ncbi:hypothetical protein BVG81_001910 [Haliangium sp. UPWRP_2]|nr:hypothetical protein BVG81_001910 [Haliangium sp. UPWRP_2]
MDPLYVIARKTLLDALDALVSHRDALILVGAQAIYLHVGEADLAVAPYTTDGDLALDPQLLGDDPNIEAAMTRAGFSLKNPPGLWRSQIDIQIDLLVPDAVGGDGSRGARLGIHGNLVARKARGLEAALVDKAERSISALEPNDHRVHRLAVAGPAALLVAKLHKLAERLAADPRRLKAKDALDVYRLLRNIPGTSLATSLKALNENEVSRTVTTEAIGHLRALFGFAESKGAQLAVQAAEGLENPLTIAASCAALATELLARF